MISSVPLIISVKLSTRPKPDLTETILARLNKAGKGDIDRTGNIGSTLSGLLSGGFETLGYIPIAEAVGQCEGRARYLVEHAVNQLRSEAERQFAALSEDIEARCRSYVEYAAGQCEARVNSLASALEVEGRSLLTRVQEECQEETLVLVNRTSVQEEARYRALGEQEEERLRQQYTEEGKVEEKKVLADFEKRGKDLEAKIRAEYELRGKEAETTIRREFELRGEVEAKTVELELRKRGEMEAITIRKEFEDRGAVLEEQIRKEFEERGEKERDNIEKEFRDRGERARERGEEQCTDMINMACENVTEGTESEDFCLEFLFFTGDIGEEERKRRRRRLGLLRLA